MARFGLCVGVCLLSGLTVGSLVADEPTRDVRADRGQPGWLLPVPELEADERIPTLREVLPHGWGQDVSDPAEIVRYLTALAAAAPERTKLVEYGRSYESRPLVYLVITSPENLQRLDEIQAHSQRLADPRGCDAATAAALIEKMPAIVWLGYCVHGNESSGSDAALLTAYHLLADRREATAQLLQQTVVIIDPLQNPDGRQRFIAAYREARGVFPQSEPAATDHSERWPGGRFNHYLFDMNRDWFLQTQTESRARTAAMLAWRPQITVDAHEMGHNSTYYFAPPTDPINQLIAPRQQQWYERLGAAQAARFDQYGFAYTAREMFDSFYPGYGESWPSMHGAIGVLWEQAGVRGLLIDRDDQTTLAYHQAVRHHYVSGLATVETAARERRQLLEDCYQVHVDTVRAGREGTARHAFLSADLRPDRAARVAALLRQNGIEVGRLAEGLQVRGQSVMSGAAVERSLPAGSYHVSFAQPAGRLARSLLERHAELDSQFVERQLERRRRELDDEFYDVTAWSLPLAFDVECLISPEDLQPKLSDQLEPAVPAFPETPAKVAYLVDGQSDAALLALAGWLRAGYRVHVADQDLELNGRRFGRGALILKVHENPSSLGDAVREAATRHGLSVLASDTAFVSRGAQLGGPNVSWVKPPRVVLAFDRPASFTAGHTWYAFDQLWHYPVTRVATRYLDEVDWSRVDVLILPDGSWGGSEGLSPAVIKRISSWVEEGGTLIAIKGAARFAASEAAGWLHCKPRVQGDVPQQSAGPQPTPAAAPPPGTPSATTASSTPENEELDPAAPPDDIPGSFLRVTVYDDHWATYGCPTEMNLMYTGDLAFTPLAARQGRNLLRFVDRDDLLVSGFCWPRTLQLFRGQTAAVYESRGAGHVVAFAEDPNFRGLSPAAQRLFLNAVFFGPGH